MEDAGYVTQLRYVWGYFDEMSPHAIHLAAWMVGHAGVPLNRPFRYLELGCGFGLSVASFAALHPQASFHGVDLNPEHVESGRALARQGGLDNLTLEVASFEALLEQELEPFDFIALHGVYSWVSGEVRAQIHRLLARFLKPGGLVYLSYNALPGWAPSLPFRTMLLSYIDSMAREAPLEQRVRQGMTYLKFLRDNQAGVFRDNPKAVRKLDRLLGASTNYLVHEFLNEHWTPFYFHEVAGVLRPLGLHFAGCIPYERNFPELCAPEVFLPLLKSAETRDTYETHRDFVLDESFRRDIYVRDASPQAESTLLAAWADVWFAPPPLGARPQSLTPVAEQLVERLRQAPATLAELAQEMPAGTLVGLLRRLCALGQLRTYHGAPGMAPIEGPQGVGGPQRVRSPFNRALLETRLLADLGVRLVAPQTGAVIGLDVVDGLTLLAWEQPSSERVAQVAGLLGRHGASLLEEGRPIEDPAQLAAHLEKRIARFETVVLPALKAHGIVEPVQASA